MNGTLRANTEYTQQNPCLRSYPTNITYLFKVNNTIKTLKKVLNMFKFQNLLLTFNILHNFFYCFYCWFEQVNVSWVPSLMFSLIPLYMHLHLEEPEFSIGYRGDLYKVNKINTGTTTTKNQTTTVLIQLTITSSKLTTIGTLEKGVKYV